MMIETESVYQAIAAYGSQDFQVSSNAAKWLDEFQKSILAWSISDRIIAEARSFDTCFFAAQTIRQKVLSYFRELPPTSYASLRDSIISHLQTVESKISRDCSTIVTQLAAALADLYLQVPDLEGDFLGELLGRLTKERDAASLANVVVTLLRVFPEEMQNRQLRIGKNRRSTVEKALADKTDTVVGLLSQICSGNGVNLTLQVKVISCLSSWMLNSQCPSTSLAGSPLILSILCALQSPSCEIEMHDSATECVVNALYLAEDLRKHLELATVLQNGIYQTLAAFTAALNDEDQDKIQNYARIYCELCETLLPEIASSPGSGLGDLKSIDLVLLTNDYHDYSIVEKSFNLWYRLSEYLYQLDENEFEDVRPTFQPYVKRLILSLCNHCCLDTDMDGVLDQKSDIADFRRKAAEAVKDVAFVVGSLDLLKEMIELLKSYSTKGWDNMESALYIISCFIHNIAESEDTVIPYLLQSIFSLPATTHAMLLSTSAQLLGNLQDWLNHNVDYLTLAAQWLISLSVNAIFLRTLAESLENICEKGYRALGQQFDSIVQIIQRVGAAQIRGQEEEDALLCLLRAATHLLNDLPAGELVHKLEQLCLPGLQYLERPGVNEVDKENSAGFVNDAHLMLCLDGLAAIFRILKSWQTQQTFSVEMQGSGYNAGHLPPVPWMGLVARVWRSISTVLDDYKSNARVVERACRTIRFLVRSMGTQSVHFIEQLVGLMIQIYNEHPHSCFLYLASILTDEHGALSDLQPGLIHMLKVLSERSFSLIRDKDGMKNHPDTVDDLFRLAIRFVQRAPVAFFREPISYSLFLAAIMGLDVEHTEANKSVTKFISEVVDLGIGKKGGEGESTSMSESTAAARQLVIVHGEQLTWHCIESAILHLPATQRRDVADIIYQLLQFDKERFSTWLATSIGNLPHDTGLAATSQQLSDFRDQVMKADKSYVVGGAIRDLSRYYS